jgi:hypothetical protein
VVGGLYDAEDNGLDDNNTATYYRVDFSTGTGDTEVFLDVLRNHLYTFTIEEVSSAGHNELDDAFEDGSDNLLSAKVTAWNMAGQNVIAHGQHYLNVNEGEITLEAANGTAKFVAETNYTIDDRGFPAGIVVEQSEDSEWLALSLSGNSGDLSRTVTLTATENPLPGDRTAKVRIRAGNLTKVITVTQKEKLFYVGRFGGALKRTGNEWKFERTLYIQSKNQGGTTYIWGPDGDTAADSYWDGKDNTWAIRTPTYPAANACFTKNSGYASITEKDDPNYQWYLPAQRQLMAAWVSHNSFDEASEGLWHWSSTEYDVSYAWDASLVSGNTSFTTTKTNNSYAVRCVREVTR